MIAAIIAAFAAMIIMCRFSNSKVVKTDTSSIFTRTELTIIDQDTTEASNSELSYWLVGSQDSFQTGINQLFVPIPRPITGRHYAPSGLIKGIYPEIQTYPDFSTYPEITGNRTLNA